VVVKILFNHIEIGAGGLAEVIKFITFELEIFTGGNFFINTIQPNLVADSHLVRIMGLILPVFIPNPNILLVMEEFAAMSFGYRAKNGAAEARFGIN